MTSRPDATLPDDGIPEAAEQPYQPGSQADFDRLYRDSHGRIVGTLTGILRDPGAAEECAQETFLRAFRAWARWRPDAPAEAWLHRIALNVAGSYRRLEGLRSLPSLLRLVGRPDDAPSPEDRTAHTDLVVALRRMPMRQAAIVVLRHHHGYSNRRSRLRSAFPRAPSPRGSRPLSSDFEPSSTAPSTAPRRSGDGEPPRVVSSATSGVIGDMEEHFDGGWRGSWTPRSRPRS